MSNKNLDFPLFLKNEGIWLLWAHIQYDSNKLEVEVTFSFKWDLSIRYTLGNGGDCGTL